MRLSKYLTENIETKTVNLTLTFDERSELLRHFEMFDENIEHDMENLLDSLSEGKDYGSKVDALVDSMGVTENKVAQGHVRKDLDTL